MKVLLALVMTLYVVPAWADTTTVVPTCRQDSSHANDVLEAFNAIRINWGKTALASLSYQKAIVNSEGGPTDLKVRLVKDAFASNVNDDGCVKKGPSGGKLDSHSVSGVCQVDGSAAIRCSADAVHALIESEPNGRHPNPALVLLLAHEISHLVHGDPGASYTSALTTLTRSRPENAKWQTLIRACIEPSITDAKDKFNREVRADEEAIILIEQLVHTIAEKDTTASPKSIRALLMGSVEASLSGLRQWQASWFGKRDLPIIETPDEGEDPNVFAQWAADRWLCNALEPGEGTMLIPQIAADHPMGSARLSRLSERFTLFSLPKRDSSTIDQFGVGNFQDLLQKIPDVWKIIDRQEAQADVSRTNAFCERVRRTKAPDCASVPITFPRVPKTCPEISGHVQWQSFFPTGEVTPVVQENDQLKLNIPSLSFAQPLTNGAILVGALDRIGLIKADKVTWFEMPCIPRDAVEVPGGALVACDHPLGIVKLSETAPIEWGRADVVFQGETDTEQSRLDWIGRVGDKVLALFISGSGKSMTIDVTQKEWQTAAPWRGKGCDILVYGMKIKPIAGKLTGADQGQHTILRTARFDNEFKQTKSFTAWAKPESLACGFGLSGPVCLTEDGTIINPELEHQNIIGTLPLGTLLQEGNHRASSICSTGSSIFSLIQVKQNDGNSIVEVHKVRNGEETRLLHKDWSEGVGLRCTEDEAVVTISNGHAGLLYRFQGK